MHVWLDRTKSTWPDPSLLKLVCAHWPGEQVGVLSFPLSASDCFSPFFLPRRNFPAFLAPPTVLLMSCDPMALHIVTDTSSGEWRLDLDGWKRSQHLGTTAGHHHRATRHMKMHRREKAAAELER